ncbi:MAG TPA: Holliday junction branch migration protein RuvA [Candidatus Paceibacterota bacterium]|nr:Holliday junction branch migration protein RuvA [Candidatus Paceibacterota bacterium]
MIRNIRGTVLSVSPLSVVIDVAGFGVEVYTSTPDSFIVGDTATLSTHLVLKKDGLDLYGFPESADRDFFELILSVSGIGPKTAQNILRKAPRAALEGAIGKRDLTYLTKVIGLGKKSAEKILIELTDKIGPRVHDDADTEVFDTLVALGYTEREARKALQDIPESTTGKDKRLKAALSSGA